jgi:S-layer protein
MTVTTAQVTTLLENVLFESSTVATGQTAQFTAIANFSAATSTVSGLSAYLATQPEATIAEQVIRYYEGALGRVPSPSEISFYVGYLEKGLNASQLALGTASITTAQWAQVAAFFTNSPEFVKDFGLAGGITASNEGLVVTGFYANVLGRAPSASEIQFYENAIANGTATPTTLLEFFANSPEFVTKVSASIQSDLAAAGSTAVTAAAAGTNPLASTAPVGVIPVPVGSTTALTFNAASPTYVAGITVSGNSGSASNTLALNDGGSAGTFNLSLPAGATVSNIQTLDINGVSTDGLTFNGTTGWSSLNTLAITSGGYQTLTVGSGVTVTDTDTLTAAAATPTATTIDGGSAITLTATGATSGLNVVDGAVTIGGSTAPTGAVTATVTQTAGVAASTAGTITVDGGTNVAVTATINAGFSGLTPGSVIVAGATGTINVASTLKITDHAGAADAFTGAAVSTTGGTTVVINETVTNSTAAVSTAGIATATDGAVTVLDGGTATTVTINQTQASAKAFVAAVAPSAGSTTAGGPGYSAVTTAGSSGSAAVLGAVAVAAGVVKVAGASATAQTLGNASSTITGVTLAGFANGSFINSTALKTLTLSGTGGTLTIDNLATVPNTALTLDLNKFKGTGAISEAGVTTLNVVTGGTGSSSLSAYTDAALTTLNVSGTQSLKYSTLNGTLTAINVSGAAGFSDGATAVTGGAAALGSALTVTTTSSGTINLALDDLHQTFAGSTGTDVIIIDGHTDATKAINAGSATNNELILDGTNNAAYGLTAATAAKVTGFQILGVEANVTGTIDLSVLDATASKLDIIGNSTIAFTKVAQNAAVNLDASSTSVSVTYADAAGSTDAVGLTIGASTNSAVITTTALTLKDANAVGVGTLNIVSNETSGAANVITTLVDNGLSHLNVSGSGALTITTLNEATTQATSFAINNTSGGKVTITNFTDNNLGSLAFSGSASSVITNLNDTGHVIGITNTGTAHATVTTLTDAAITTLTLGAGVTLGTDNSVLVFNTGLVSTQTAGVTVSGASDNAHVVIDLSAGAIAAATDSITLGNGNDVITDASTAGAVVISLGTGANYVVANTGGNNATYSEAITLATHTSTAASFDFLSVSVTGSQTAGYAAAITGGAVHDQVELHGDVGQSNVLTFSATQLAALASTTTYATLGAAITAAYTTLHGVVGHAANDVAAFVYGGNTYVINDTADTGAFVAGTDSIVELVGTHTIAQVTAAGHATFSIAS